MSVLIDQIYPYFFQKNKDKPLFNAAIYIGEADLDPEIEANQKVVVGIQEGVEVPLNQPLTTNSGGGITYNGSPVRVKVEPPYSMKVLTNKGVTEYYWPYINPTGGAPTIGATISERVVLTDGQTTVNLTNQLNGYISVRVNNEFIDNSVLNPADDYNQVNQTQLELVDTYPTGTVLTVIQNDLSGDSKGPVNCYETAAAAEAANLAVGSCFCVTALGGAKFTVQDVGYAKLTGDLTIANGLDAKLNHDADGSYSVLYFGADGSIDTATNQQPFFALAALRAVEDENGTNKSPIIDIPGGNFRLDSDTVNKATWRKSPSAKIIGLAGVSPTFEDDTSRLLGTVIDYSGVDQQRTIRVGDPKFHVQKYTQKGYASEITANSDDASGGLTGTTYASASDTVNEACIACTLVGLQDNTNVVKSVWALYLEGVRDVGNDSAVFCMESTMFNRGPLVQSSPYGKIHLPQDGQPAWNLWLTSGGTQAGVQDCNPATGAIGIKANEGVPFDKGILFKDGSVSTPGIAIATPDSYKWAWYGEVLSEEVISCQIVGGLPNNGQFTIDTYNATSEALESIIVTPFQISPVITNQVALGAPGTRYQNLYLNNAPDVVSDINKKTAQRSLDSNEMQAGLALARNVQLFKWISEVSNKGLEDAYFHASVMAQEAWQILIDHDLEPTSYGFISNNSEHGWSVTQSELAFIMCAALVQNQDLIEQRLAALEA